MIYRVRATFKDETAAAFLTKLTDGTIQNQRPDGPELIASMDRAVVNTKSQIEWTELCFCAPPLAHERDTVLDLHFDDIETEPIEAHSKCAGQPFMAHLQELAG
ncbi:MAG: hypothetical protein ABJH63_13220 [Rhizobiaceae bacterium]